MAGNGNPKSMANLKPTKKGDVLNPYGRGGKDGTKGLSLKNLLKARLAKMEKDEIDSFFEGLLLKARDGDHQAMKLLLLMNDEPLESVKVEADTGVRIQITMPAKDNDC